MKLNAKKTFLFVVNFTKNHQFRPWLKVPGENNYLETVPKTKLLGYWLTTDMKPHVHIQYLLSIVNNRMWFMASSLSFKKKYDGDRPTHIYIYRAIMELKILTFLHK